VKIIVIDDHPVVRKGLEQTISFEENMEIVGSAVTCKEGLELIVTQSPDLAIVDLKLPDGSGLDLVRRAREVAQGCCFLILTAYGSSREISRVISEQVEGYILKDALPEEIINAARLVGKGRRYFDPQAMESIVEGEKDPLKCLTAREKEILQEISAGMNNRDIAKKFFISEKTVKKHVSNIMAKLGVQGRIQAALMGLSQEKEQGQN